MGTHFRGRDTYTQLLEFTPATRDAIETAIELLVEMLDRFDPDPDLEAGGDDEPWLAGFGGNANGGDDREEDLADDEDGHDREHDPTGGYEYGGEYGPDLPEKVERVWDNDRNLELWG